MANWAKTTEPGTALTLSQRRKWNLENRTALKELKYRIAEDGCSSTQYDLARQLLEEKSEPDSATSYSQGVHWLMKAADQGHEGALLLLNECYQTRRGIDDRNECEVQRFLAMSPGERAARKAARELFACLSKGEEYITVAQLERKLREIYKLQKKKRTKWNKTGSTDDEDNDNDYNVTTTLHNSSSTSVNGHFISSSSPTRYRANKDLCNSDTITESNLLAAASDYANGYLPNVGGQELILSVPHPRSLDHVPCFHRLLFHPILFLLLYYHRLINILSTFPESTKSHLQFILLLFLYLALLANDNLLMFVPIALYYVSLMVMIVSSVKMIKTKHEFVDFRMWSGLFLRYGDNMNAEEPENQFLRNNMKPYLWFFVAFFLNVILYPLITADQWMPHSEITIVSFCFVFVTMFAFMYSSYCPFPDLLVLVSFGVNVLAKYPYEMDTVVLTGWRFLDLKIPNFPSFVIGNGIEFCLNCRALLYLLIPGFLLLLARRRNWYGTYQYLIPHCVTLSWLQICIISSECATMFGLVRAALGLAGLLLFLPLFGVVTLMVPVFAAIEWLSLTDPTVRTAASVFTAIFVIVASCLMASNNRTEKYITIVQIFVCIFATIFLTVPYMTAYFETSHSSSIFHALIHQQPTKYHNKEHDVSVSNLSWEQYQKYCHQPAWEHMNVIGTQLRCSQLDGTIIKWEGTVTSLEISRVFNIRADIIYNYLPATLAELIACWYGDRNTVNCLNEIEPCDEIHQLFTEQKRCNLNRWNTYEYDITVRMNAAGILTKPTEIVLKAIHDFGNFTVRLNISNRIWFKGQLKNQRGSIDAGSAGQLGNGKEIYMTLGRLRPTLRLMAIGCVHCPATGGNIEAFQITDNGGFSAINGRIKDLYRGVKYLLNVLFNPLVIFK